MTKVKFLQDYRGILTGERFYAAGAVVEFAPDIAAALVAQSRAEMVKEKPAPPPEPAPKRKRRASKK